MKQIKFMLLALAFTLPSLAQSTSSPAPIKVLLEANEWNRKQLLEKLNENGAKHRIKFISAEKDYDYKIQFTTGKTQEAMVVQGTGGTADYDTGFATVYDSHDAELFQIKREGMWSERGATNKIAKEIIKRISRLRPRQEKR